VIKVEQLYKYFKQVKALDGISFEVKKGELFGLLGPNGAGKTTTVRIISTLIPPTKGQVEINGYFLPKDAAIIRNFIGYVPQALSSDGTLTGYENLLIFAKLVGLNRSEREKQINELVELMGIGDFVDSSSHQSTKLCGGNIERYISHRCIYEYALACWLAYRHDTHCSGHSNTALSKACKLRTKILILRKKYIQNKLKSGGRDISWLLYY